jgi:hypothetical protein
VHKKKIHPDIIVPSADTVTASDDDDANDATLKRAVQFLKEHGHGKVATATVPN